MNNSYKKEHPGMDVIIQIASCRGEIVSNSIQVYPRQKIKKADKIDFLKQGKRGSNPR